MIIRVKCCFLTLFVQNKTLYTPSKTLYKGENERILLGYTGTESNLTLPSYITKINSYAFSSCTNLTSVVIPDSVTSIGDSAFGDCSNLTSVKMGAGVTSIGGGAFICCTGLTSVEIGGSVISIGESAFYICSNLTSVIIPDSVTSIGDYAFEACYNLTSVYYKGTAEDWAKISIGFANSPLTKEKMYYYSKTKPTEEGKYWYYDENGKAAVW